jgi:hypothetical protein
MANRVLVISGDQYHPASDVLEGLTAIGREGVNFELAPSGPFTMGNHSYDAIVFAKLNVSSPTDQTPWVTPEMDQEIGERILTGTGFLVIHAGTVGYSNSPTIRRITGGQFVHHPEPCDVTVSPVGEFGVASDPFTIWDEHYFVETDPTVEVILEAESIHGRQPAGWTNRHGSGRVCVLTPGHFSAVWQDAGFLELVRYGLETVING